MSVFFTADTHFGHANIIKYSNRPYQHVNDMDDELCYNWNSVVSPEDFVYHLGDFSFGKADKYLAQLNGHIFFVPGNHDREMRRIREEKRWNHKITWLPELAEVVIGEQRIVLCHYALRVWRKSHHGTWHLYGHSHGSLPEDPHSRSFDVGVDVHNYHPISFQEVEKRMSKKQWKPVDHHGAEQ